MRPISELHGMFAGQEVWVLGNGPSIWRVPFGRIPVERAIGCNRILKTHDCSFVVVVDKMVWEQEQERFRNRQINLIIRQGLHDDIKGAYPELLLWDFLTATGSNIRPFELPTVLYYGIITGYYAAEIACRMAMPGGTVILAGMDLRYTDQMLQDRETHASGDERPNGACDMRFPEGRGALRYLRARASHLGVSMRVVHPSALELDGFPVWQE